MNGVLQVFDGQDPKADSVIKKIIKSYNDDPETIGFTSTLPNRQDMVVICFEVEGTGEFIGGLVMDTARNETTGKVIGMCQILVVTSTYRGCGVARALVTTAKEVCQNNNLIFGGAYVEFGTDEDELWKHLGYPHQGNLGMGIIMTCAPLKELLGE